MHHDDRLAGYATQFGGRQPKFLIYPLCFISGERQTSCSWTPSPKLGAAQNPHAPHFFCVNSTEHQNGRLVGLRRLSQGQPKFITSFPSLVSFLAITNPAACVLHRPSWGQPKFLMDLFVCNFRRAPEWQARLPVRPPFFALVKRPAHIKLRGS